MIITFLINSINHKLLHKTNNNKTFNVPFIMNIKYTNIQTKPILKISILITKIVYLLYYKILKKY